MCVHMVSALTRLFALIALVLMPLGMGAAPALAEPANHDMSAMAGHCEQQRDGDDAPAPAAMDCTAACTAVAPSSAARIAECVMQEMAQVDVAVAPFTGIVLDIATPPPRCG